MDTVSNDKKAKLIKPATHTSLRVKKETRRRVLTEIAKANRKDFGRRIHPDEYIALAVSLVTAEHVKRLQEASLSNADRLEREYREYVSKHGAISEDEYLGRRLSGEIRTSSKNENHDKMPEKQP